MSKKDEDEKVLTPGGMRPRSAVREVKPGEVVSGAGENPAIKSDTSGGTAVRDPGDPNLVLTPGGFRSKSLVHHITTEHKLDFRGGDIRKVHLSGHVETLGKLIKRPGPGPLMPANVARRSGPLPALGSGWIVYADWTNNTGNPVLSFSSTWVVPPAPTTDHGQTIFLFNGIQNSTMIYQPVLQWGPSAAGGGSYWAVASWYVDGQGGVAFHSSLVNVNEGDQLVGVMTETGQSGTAFDYYCEFTGIANTGLTINAVDELTWNIETLESYGVQVCSDYPNTSRTAFTNIAFQTSAGNPVLDWIPVNAVTDCGQSAVVVSDANPGGEVDLYYSAQGFTSVTGSINSDGRLESFLTEQDGSAWNIWQTAPSSGPWSATNNLGGVVIRPLCAALNSDGRLEIFGVGSDSAAYNNWQTAPASGPWSGWNSLGGSVSDLAVACNSDGRLELFGIGGGGALYNNWQTAPHSGPWSGWNLLGGSVQQIRAALNTDGRLEVFGIGTDNALYNIWQTAPHAGPWSGWNSLGGWVSQISAAVNSDGRLEVFGIGNDGALYNIWQTAPHSGPWSGWNRLGGVVQQIVAMRNGDGRLEVFGIGSDNALYNIWQQSPSSGPWIGWNNLGGWVSYISAALNADGRLEAFGIGSDQQLYNMWQTAPSSGPWSGWNRLT